MNKKKALVLIEREFLHRIKSKSFWINTLVVPIIMIAIGILPRFFISKMHQTEKMKIVDESGYLGVKLANYLKSIHSSEQNANIKSKDPTIEFKVLEVIESKKFDKEASKLDKEILDNKIDSWLYITEEGEFIYRSKNVSKVVTLTKLEQAVNDVTRFDRLRRKGLSADEIATIFSPIRLETFKVTPEGAKRETSGSRIIVAVVVMGFLYVMILLYGQIVLTGVLEEKSSKIVEIILSSATTFEMMMGKIIGIASVALIQIFLWISFALFLASPYTAKIAQNIASIPVPQLPPIPFYLALHLVFLFILGYLFYASFYALLGSAFNDIQEVQNMGNLVIPFIIAPWLIFIPIINDPDSFISVISTFIPPLTPLILALRIAVKVPPLWQQIMAYLVLIIGDILMIWMASKVYRVGILLYGKKPTVGEIWRWIVSKN